MVDRYAPLGTVTEAFAWLATCVVAGTATGMSAGGALAQSFGPSCAFILAGLSGTAALAVACLRSGSLTEPTAPTTGTEMRYASVGGQGSPPSRSGFAPRGRCEMGGA
jgi:hypothetical protein